MTNDTTTHETAFRNLSFEHSVIQALLDLEHARVEAQKHVRLAEIRAEADEAAEARAARREAREGVLRALRLVGELWGEWLLEKLEPLATELEPLAAAARACGEREALE